MSEVVKIAGWREEGEEEEEMASRKRLTSLGVRTYSRQLLSRARKSSDFNITQRLEVDAHVCACVNVCKGGAGRACAAARDLTGHRNEERNFFWLVEHCSTTTKMNP
jgi:hypothetical protein